MVNGPASSVRAIELPANLWARLSRLQRLEGMATLDGAVARAIDAGYDVLTANECEAVPFAEALSGSAALHLLTEAGLDVLGVSSEATDYGL